MIQKEYNKKVLSKVFRRLQNGLSFPCMILFVKRGMFSLWGKRCFVKIDSSDRSIPDIIIII